jgi:hypothetical protein
MSKAEKMRELRERKSRGMNEESNEAERNERSSFQMNVKLILLIVHNAHTLKQSSVHARNYAETGFRLLKILFALFSAQFC